MKYIFSIIIAISFTGCAVTWTTVGAFAVGAVTVAENVAEVATIYKDTKEYLSDSNSTKEK